MNRLPSDYERCGTCGYDHLYDFPYLNKTQMIKVRKAHSRDFRDNFGSGSKDPRRVSAGKKAWRTRKRNGNV